MTAEMGQLVGLAAAAALYVAAITATPVAIFARIRRLPADWHNHPELCDFYARRPGPRPLPLDAGGWPRALFLATAAVSGLVALTGPSVIVELAISAIGAGMMTAGTTKARTLWSSRLADTLGLEATVVDEALSPVYRKGIFVACAGLLGIACFLGGSLGVIL
jgi:hypothetical protein